jgi:hypothetical protein
MKQVCPNCKGRFVLKAFSQKGENPCELCDGTGFVNPDYVCECGRPGMKTAGAVVVCTQEQCFERATAEQKKVESPKTTTAWENGDEGKYWTEMYGY